MQMNSAIPVIGLVWSGGNAPHLWPPWRTNDAMRGPASGA
jgi:hypothetical protein